MAEPGWTSFVHRIGFFLVTIILLASNIFAQQPLAVHPVQRVLGAIDLNDTAKLTGQVHFLARDEFDRGPVPDHLAMDRITLLLKGTAEQESALAQLLIEQQDSHSANYHHWLTPDEFGARFGVDNNDLQTIVGWLQARGFHDVVVSKSRLSIQFSGTASQVSNAFRTEIDNYTVKGTDFIANRREPSIPSAFASVVRGFASLNSYPRRSFAKVAKASGTPGGASLPQYNTTSGGHALGPNDFATIYNVSPLWNSGIDGTGVSIAIVGRSRYTNDASQFEDIFHTPFNDPRGITNGPDPGIASEGDSIEISLDIEWAMAVATRATIYYVVSASTNASDGIDLSAQYAVENNVADIISVSYGFCEADTASTRFYQQLWRQAAAQGISVVVSAGDSGSAGCDDPNLKTPSTHGLAVSGLASSTDNVAVGGTTLNDRPNPATYWSATNDDHLASALGYIPETTWNDSSSTSIFAGGGGVSSANPAPVWQVGTGVPASDPGRTGQHHRYLPDVSLNAAAHVPYYVCAMSSCSFVDSNGQFEHYLVYGTSASAPAFAGIMALVDQKAGGRQGNPNFHLYPLSKTPGVYHDVTSGTNAVSCTSGMGCGDGVLTGYAAQVGYDLATGWGSVDANALVTNWGNISFIPTTITASASPTDLVHGSPITFTVSVGSGSGTPSGSVDAFTVQNGTVAEIGNAVLANGTATWSSSKAPGGDSTLYIRYAGDGVYGSSISDGIPITVARENVNMTMSPTSRTRAIGDTSLITVNIGSSSSTAPTGMVTLVYGDTNVTYPEQLIAGTAYVVESWRVPGVGTYQMSVNYSGDGNYNPANIPWSLTITQGTPVVYMNCSMSTSSMVQGYSVPCSTRIDALGGPAATGTVQYTDNGSPLGGPMLLQNGAVSFDLGTLPVGSHVIGAQYSGDTNYVAKSNQSFPFTVVAKGTVLPQVSGDTSQYPGQAGFTYLQLHTQQLGPGMHGTATLYDGSTALATYTVQGGGAWSMIPYLNSTSAPMSLGTHPLTLSYTGDPTYSDSTSAVFNLLISNPDFTITGLNDLTVTRGSSKFEYVTIRPIAGLTGNISLTCTGAPAESTCTIGSPASINSTPMLTVSTTAPHTAALHHNRGTLTFALAIAVAVCVFSRKRARNALALPAVFCLMSALSCGGGGGGSPSNGGGGGTTPTGGTPTGVYTLTVTATYGSGTTAITHSYPFKLTVQ